MALVQPKIRQGSDSSGLHTPTATRITPPLPLLPSFASHLSTPPSASHARHPPLGFSPSSFLWGVSPKGIRERDEERRQGLKCWHHFSPSPSGTSPSFLLAWQKGSAAAVGRVIGGRRRRRQEQGLGVTPGMLIHFSQGGGTEQGGASVGLCLPSVSAPLAPS